MVDLHFGIPVSTHSDTSFGSEKLVYPLPDGLSNLFQDNDSNVDIFQVWLPLEIEVLFAVMHLQRLSDELDSQKLYRVSE